MFKESRHPNNRQQTPYGLYQIDKIIFLRAAAAVSKAQKRDIADMNRAHTTEPHGPQMPIRLKTSYSDVNSLFIVSFPLEIVFMYQLFLLSALVLRIGVLGTETVRLHENDELLLAVPNADVPPQEPIVRVVARDLDKVKVVPYASDEGVNKRNGGFEGRSVPKDGHNSREAITARSHQRQHQRPHPSHGHLKKTRRSSHRGAQYDEADVFGLDQSPLNSLPTAMPAFTAYLGQGQNNNPTCNVKAPSPRRYCAPQNRMNMCACREALNRERYCIATLRRAKLCKDQYNVGQRHVQWDPTERPRAHHQWKRKQAHYDPAGMRRGHHHSRNKRANHRSRNKRRAHHDPVGRRNDRHHFKNKRARHQSKGKGRAHHDPVGKTNARRHLKSKRSHNSSKAKRARQ